MVTWSQLCVNGHVIPISISTSSFASNQTSNIFHPKILHALFSAFNLPRTDSDITSYTSALALSGEEVLRILRSRGQAAYLMAGSREKTTYRSAPFPSGGGGARDALQRKATGGATSKVVRETAGWTRSDLTLGTSTSASTRPSLCGGDGKRSRRNSRWSSGFTQMDPDGWLDISAWFISWIRLRLGPLGLQKG